MCCDNDSVAKPTRQPEESTLMMMKKQVMQFQRFGTGGRRAEDSMVSDIPTRQATLVLTGTERGANGKATSQGELDGKQSYGCKEFEALHGSQ